MSLEKFKKLSTGQITTIKKKVPAVAEAAFKKELEAALEKFRKEIEKVSLNGGASSLISKIGDVNARTKSISKLVSSQSNDKKFSKEVKAILDKIDENTKIIRKTHEKWSNNHFLVAKSMDKLQSSLGSDFSDIEKLRLELHFFYKNIVVAAVKYKYKKIPENKLGPICGTKDISKVLDEIVAAGFSGTNWKKLVVMVGQREKAAISAAKTLSTGLEAMEKVALDQEWNHKGTETAKYLAHAQAATKQILNGYNTIAGKLQGQLAIVPDVHEDCASSMESIKLR